MREREQKFPGQACGHCGQPTRTMYPQGRGGGKNTRSQHSRWYVCRRGHKVYRKRRQ